SSFTGTITSSGTETVNFSGIERLADGATIRGQVFNDVNGNGVQDVRNDDDDDDDDDDDQGDNNNQGNDDNDHDHRGEAGLAGIMVGLDVNGDGMADLTTTTDSDGRFAFTGVFPGNASVHVIPPAGATVTTPNPVDVTATLHGQNTVNFGVQLSPA